MSSKEYLLLNIIFGALFFSVLITGLIIEADMQISCQVLKETGKECKGCGLTRDFISFSHFDYKDPINANSLSIYVWIVIQCFVRIGIMAVSKGIRPKFMLFDLVFTIGSALYVFLPLWM